MIKLKKNFKFIDLFSAIRGIRIPFSQLNGKCVFSSEIDKFARQTYENNFNEVSSGDIPNFNLLLAGFPCQSFSMAGKKKDLKMLEENYFLK